MSQNDEFTVEVLRDLGLLTKSQIDHARAEVGESGLLQTLLQSGALTQQDVSRALAAQNSMEFVDLAQIQVERSVVGLMQAEDARRYQAVPIALREGVLIIALADPMAMQTMDDLTYKLRRDMEFVCATPEAIQKLILRFHGDADDAASGLLKSMGDRSPKDNQKKSSQKSAAASSSAAKKSQAIADKKAVPGKKK